GRTAGGVRVCDGIDPPRRSFDGNVFATRRLGRLQLGEQVISHAESAFENIGLDMQHRRRHLPQHRARRHPCRKTGVPRPDVLDIVLPGAFGSIRGFHEVLSSTNLMVRRPPTRLATAGFRRLEATRQRNWPLKLAYPTPPPFCWPVNAPSPFLTHA